LDVGGIVTVTFAPDGDAAFAATGCPGTSGADVVVSSGF
jgi:hypothetical protein